MCGFKRSKPWKLSEFYTLRTGWANRLDRSCRVGEMLAEPFQGLLGHLLERSRFFKQMRRTRNDHQLLWAAEKPVGMLIHLDHGVIFAAYQEQGRRDHLRQETFGEVRTPPRDTMAPTSKEACAAAWSAAAAPVLAPK